MVRSEYKLLLQRLNTFKPNNYPTDYVFFYKNKLRQTDYLAIIRIMNWRIFNSFIPTFSNLHYRRLKNSVTYPRCLDGNETIDHVFRDCNTIKDI